MITYRKSLNNIRKVLKEATPAEYQEGQAWYDEGSRQIHAIAYAAQIDPKVVAHITAALSPAIQWDTNLEATRKLVGKVFEGLNIYQEIDDLVLPGYPQNVQKAKSILRNYLRGYDSWEYILSGQKVKAFAEQLYNPLSDEAVTIDAHAFSVAAGKVYTTKTCPNITDKRHRIISAAYRKVAKENNISAAQLQAITWLTWRRIHK